MDPIETLHKPQCFGRKSHLACTYWTSYKFRSNMAARRLDASLYHPGELDPRRVCRSRHSQRALPVGSSGTCCSATQHQRPKTRSLRRGTESDRAIRVIRDPAAPCDRSRGSPLFFFGKYPPWKWNMALKGMQCSSMNRLYSTSMIVLGRVYGAR